MMQITHNTLTEIVAAYHASAGPAHTLPNGGRVSRVPFVHTDDSGISFTHNGSEHTLTAEATGHDDGWELNAAFERAIRS